MTVVGSFGSGYYGIHVDLRHRASTSEHVLDATLHASGITGRTEMYKTGTDTSGTPQHPTLTAGETASVAAFTIPLADAGHGAHPARRSSRSARRRDRPAKTLPAHSLSEHVGVSRSLMVRQRRDDQCQGLAGIPRM